MCRYRPGKLLDCPGLAAGERVRLRRMQRTLARAKRSSNRRARVRHANARLRARESDRNVRQKAGLNREILRSGWGLLVRRLEDKAPGRVQKVIAAFTSQRCSACGQVDAESPESQARFACTAGGFAGNADVNAARNIAAGHAVTARGGFRDAGPANREPQLLLPSV
jgi:putative transposase